MPPESKPSEDPEQSGGVGSEVVDPTKNVLDLVRAESKYQDAVRESESKYQDGMRWAESKYQDGMRWAEQKRQDDLAKMRDEMRRAEQSRQDDLAKMRASYERRIAELLSVQVKTTSDLISAQLDKVTTALSTEISTLTANMQNQFSSISTNLGERLAQLERFRYEWGGRSAVSDPATSEALKEMAASIRTLRASEDQSRGKGVGRGEIVAWAVAALTMAVALSALLKT